MKATLSEQGEAVGHAHSEAALTPTRASRLRRVALRWMRVYGIVAGVYLLALALWEAASRIFSIPVYLLPSPLTITESVLNNFGRLVHHTQVTLGEVGLGFLLAALVSIPIGVLLVYSELMERVISPLLVAFQATPKVAFAPILVVWFGFGVTPKVILALITAAFPIVINTVIGMNQMPREMLHLMRSLGASSWQIFAKARIPVAAPYIFGGFRIGITLAVVGAVVGEFIASNSGLGFLLLVANNNLETPMLFAVVAVLAVMSSLLFFAIEALEAVLLPRPLRRRQQKLDAGVNT